MSMGYADSESAGSNILQFKTNVKSKIDRYILIDHEPVPCDDLITWAKWLEVDKDRRRVASTKIGEIWVSTVFLGLDHSFLEDGPPILFETMIFGLPEEEEYQTRCATWAEALIMHDKAITFVKRDTWIKRKLRRFQRSLVIWRLRRKFLKLSLPKCLTRLTQSLTSGRKATKDKKPKKS